MNVKDAVTVIVCTKDRPEALESCLAALARQSWKAFDVLVVDNGSAISAADVCERWSAQYLRQPKAGLCFARNMGARHAKGEVIAFIDDDSIPEETWLERLLDRFAEPAIGAVTGRIRYMKSETDNGVMSSEDAFTDASRPRQVFDRCDANWFALACLGGIGDGSNMAFRRKALLSSPGFDDRLGRGRLLDGGDEHVMFMSLLAVGHRIAHIPEAVVRHPYPGAPELARQKVMRERRTSIAYLMFLWSEFPAYRGDLLRYLVGAVGRRMPGGASRGSSGVRLTFAEAAWAAVRGVSLYREARREWATVSAPDYGVLGVSRPSA